MTNVVCSKIHRQAQHVTSNAMPSGSSFVSITNRLRAAISFKLTNYEYIESNGEYREHSYEAFSWAENTVKTLLSGYGYI